MKVLIKIKKSPGQFFLVDLQNKKLIEEVSKLIGKRKHSKAIVTALSKGKFIKEVAEQDLPNIDADLILTEEHSYFDLI